MASGDTLLVFTPQCNQPPATIYATFVNRNVHLLLAFDDATDEYAYFPGVLPRNYANGGTTVTIIWLAASATEGEVVWAVAWERHQDDVTDLDADSFAADQTVTATCASATGEPAYDTIAFTNGAQMDSLAAGESFRLRIYRDANNGDDDMAGDAQLLRIEIQET